MPRAPHQIIIDDVTRQMLRPSNFRQRGKSRFWLDDLGWCAATVEFQPVSGRLGTCLNLGISWLWYPKDHWSFDIFDQPVGLVEHTDDTPFRSAVVDMCSRALTHSAHVRATLNQPGDAIACIVKDRPSQWNDLHLGVLNGLTRQPEAALAHLTRALCPDSTVPYETERNGYLSVLLDCLNTGQDFTQLIERYVRQSRDRLKLAPLDAACFA